MKNNVIALICSSIALTLELSLLLLYYAAKNELTSDNQALLVEVKKLDLLTENCIIIIILCLSVMAASYVNILKERTKRRDFLKLINDLKF